MVKDGDVVEINYVGRIASTGEIFDLTDREIAREEELDVRDEELGPVTALLGAGHLIPGLEDAIKTMGVGQDRHIDLAAEEAFGERSRELVKTLSRKEFKNHDVTPHRGLVVEIDGEQGKVISADSGRVRVDFNHPLAGKDIAYDVQLLRKIDDLQEAVKAVIAFHDLDDAKVGVDDGFVTVTLSEAVDTDEVRDHLETELEQIAGVDSVNFAEPGGG